MTFLWITIVFAIFATFFAILQVVSIVSGWSTLERVYHHPDRFHGSRWRFQDITLRYGLTCSGCMAVGADADGLYLAFMFRLSFPPLLIPWEDLRVVWKETRFLGIRDYWVEFTSSRVPGVPIRLRPKLVKKMMADVAAVRSAAQDVVPS